MHARIALSFSGMLLFISCVLAVAAPLAEIRSVTNPANDERVHINPPPLLWPAAKERSARYSIRLSQDASFPAASTLAADGIRWAMFNPHVKLATGTWYWQYAATTGGDKQPVWSPVFRFRVEPGIREFVTPTAEKMLAAVPAQRPRVMADPKELASLRKRLAEAQITQEYSRRADRYLNGKLPDLARAQPKQKGANIFEDKNFAKWASKAFAGNLAEEITWLMPAYLATGEDRYRQDILRRGLFVADLGPNGVTAPNVSDFADGSCMRALAYAYDACYDVMTPAQRTQLREAMLARGGRFFQRTVNRLETQVASAHIWQHILMEFTEMALAVRGDQPEADAWLAYAYELWVNRFPVLGGDEGGWGEGISYFGTNMDTMLFMPSLWGRLTGVNFFDHPWYRNVPCFHMYVWPAGSASDGFGDGAEHGGPPPANRGVFFQALASQSGDPVTRWYADRLLGDKADSVLDALLTWRRLSLASPGRLLESKPPTNLPQSRAFRDTGIVSMHTDLADASRDLMVGFRSSPYGAYNHAHACQNAFNLNFAGQRLFANSGYYIGYGDPHFTGWYTQTRAHNCVLIDHKGQAGKLDGYGAILRFLDGRQISYCQGDASNAYPGTGLMRFRRQLVMLRPNVVVVYDELAADHPADWSWLLHCPAKLAADGQRLTANTSTAKAQATFFGPGPLTTSIDDRFDPPAVNWRGKKASGEVAEYPNQWHATVRPAEKSLRMRFLAILQVERPDGPPLQPPAMDAQGQIRIGPWRIEATLDVARSASLLVSREDGRAALAADHASISVGGRQYEVPPAGAILIEADRNFVETCR